MAGRIDTRIINEMIDFIFRGVPMSYVAGLPATLYLALVTEEPYALPNGTFFDKETEAVYTAYARLPIGRSLAGWLGTQGTTAASSGASGTIQPATHQYFPLCATSTQLITHVVLTPLSTRTDATFESVAYWALPRPMKLVTTGGGYYPCLYAEGLTIRLDN